MSVRLITFTTIRRRMMTLEVWKWNNALFIIRRSPYGEAARVIGQVTPAPPAG